MSMPAIMPATIRPDAVRASPIGCAIVVMADTVTVIGRGRALLTARHERGEVFGAEWNLPPGVHLTSSSQSHLVGKVQQAVRRASQ
jgi:hypothetical protein